MRIGFEPELSEGLVYVAKNKYLDLFLAPIKLLYKIPEKLLRKHLDLLVTERIVEKPFVLRNIPKKDNLKILDFGCVKSKVSIELASMGHNVLGIDFREYPFKHNNLYTYKGNILNKSLDNNRFDVVIAISSIEHAGLNIYGGNDDLEQDKKVVEKIYKTLKDDGIFIITVPFGKVQTTETMRIYNYKKLLKLLKLFKIIKEEYFIRNKDSTVWNKTNKWLAEDIIYLKNKGVDSVACLVCKKNINKNTFK